MRKGFLKLLCCPRCQKGELEIRPFRVEGDEIESGLIICEGCREWYPVVDSIPVVSTNPLLVGEIKKEMQKVWKDSFNFKSLPESESAINDIGFAVAQREQIEHYDEEAVRYDTEIADTIFWRSVVDETICPWGRSDKVRNGLILEVGCGTGASTVKLAQLGCRLVALDICLTAVKRAVAKTRALALTGQVDFIVSEAESLPFRDGMFTANVFTGVLHHVSRPNHVLKEISRVLENEGMIFGHENNASAFRFLFDLLMKIKQLWHEEAGTHPLMVAEKLKKWGAQAGLKLQTESIVFLPPHIFNLFPFSVAKALLKLTNRFWSLIPWFRDQGGLLIISGTKASAE